jgi:hypothetical protein
MNCHPERSRGICGCSSLRETGVPRPSLLGRDPLTPKPIIPICHPRIPNRHKIPICHPERSRGICGCSSFLEAGWHVLASENRSHQRLCKRARLKSCRNRRINRWALAPEGRLSRPSFYEAACEDGSMNPLNSPQIVSLHRGISDRRTKRECAQVRFFCVAV